MKYIFIAIVSIACLLGCQKKEELLPLPKDVKGSAFTPLNIPQENDKQKH